AHGLAAGLDRRAAAPRGLRERVRGRVGIGEAGTGLPGGGADAGEVDPGQQAAHVVQRGLARVDAERLLARDVAPERVPVLGSDELHEADGLEAALAADDRAEVAEDLQGFQRQAGLHVVRVVHADEGAGLPGPAGAQGTQKRELVVAQGGDISKFDPHFSTSANDIRISFNLFDNLIARHPDGKLQPSLATDWKLTNPTTWTFKLRHGVKWHNGDPFSSADVKYSFERTWDPKQNTRVSTVFTTVDKVEAPDASTVVFTTKKPDPLLAARVAFYGGQIVPKKYLEAVGNDTFNAKPVGTGPVRFVSWTKDDKIVLEAN